MVELYSLAVFLIVVGLICVAVGIAEWWKWRKESGENIIDGGGHT